MDDDIFDILHKESKKFSEFERLLNYFVEELIDTLSILTQHHFSHDDSCLKLPEKFYNDKKNIKKEMQSREYFKIYGYMICKEIQQIITDLTDNGTTQKKQLKYTKKEYPVFDKQWVEQRVQILMTKFSHNKKRDMETIRISAEKERAEKASYQEYEKAIHKELKRLVLKHCPYITGISGDGLRQIDYMLQEYMFKISESMRSLLIFKN